MKSCRQSLDRIAILDPCFHKFGGHHPEANSSLLAEFSGWPCEIFSDISIADHMNSISGHGDIHDRIKPTYNGVGYVNPDKYSNIVGFCQLGQKVARQSRRITHKVIVAHTFLHFHILGLALHLHRLRNATVIISLMFSPVEGLRESETNPLDHMFTSFALSLLNKSAMRYGHDITLGITSEVHWEMYSEMRSENFALQFTRCPWLVGAHNQKNTDFADPAWSQKRVLLYLGDAKPDKGILSLQGLVRYIGNALTSGAQSNGRSTNAKFIISIGAADEWLRPEVLKIEEACGNFPEIFEFENRYLSKEEYFEQLRNASVIVWLYDPVKYCFRTSGVFFDAVSLSCVYLKEMPRYIVGDGSWMASEARLLGLESKTIRLDLGKWDAILASCLEGDSVSNLAETVSAQKCLEPFIGSSWSEWIFKQISEKQGIKTIAITSESDRLGNALFLSTSYPHFTSLSGPTGFISYLRRATHIKARLGKTESCNWIRLFTGLLSSTDSSIHVERELVASYHKEPFDLFCVDGEHAGALVGRAKIDRRLHPEARVFAWFHQPARILRSHIIDKSSYPVKGVIPICISPCQLNFFVSDLGYKESEVLLVPHGIHKQILRKGDKACQDRLSSCKAIRQQSIRVLTVGSWLRDASLLMEAARSLSDISFTWISNGMDVNALRKDYGELPKNLNVMTNGLSNAELHGYYASSHLLFQPLTDATANNAILEAMAFGLPILTTDLPSTRWYTAEHALFFSDANSCLVALEDFARQVDRYTMVMAGELQKAATSFEWSKISAMIEKALSL